MEKKFENCSLSDLTSRQGALYPMDKDDTRSEFVRDYTRILHSTAYRRLKHKTQVFFNTSNDHVCTRNEHVQHVESVSFSIAHGLRLNTELTRAIASGHDLGHAPFGHEGEKVINIRLNKELSKEYLEPLCYMKDSATDKRIFWHEQNGLRFVDKIELLPDIDGKYHNLSLTYAVRDGIVSHCGEIDEKSIKPRKEKCDLYSIN